MVIQQPINVTLEELATEVAHLLEYYSLLGAAPDSRVSAVPDGRTIRYYTTLGILDRPKMEGRQARYGKRQVLQLLSIKALQAIGLPLSEIQSRLYGQTDNQLEALLVSLSQGRANARATAVHPTVWQEIIIEPGLKILVEKDWSPSLGTAELTEKIKAAIEALKQASDGCNGGDKA